MINQHVIVVDGNFKAVAKFWFQGAEFLAGDRGPERAKANIQDINSSADIMIRKRSFDYLNFDNVFDLEFWSNLFKADMAAG